MPFDSSFCNGQPLLIALPLGGPAHKVPYRERLAWMDNQSVNMADGQRQVSSLVLLQLHIYVAQPATYQRVMLIDGDG